MFRSLAKNAVGIKAYYQQQQKPCPLDQADWLIVQDMVVLLEPFSGVTVVLQATHYPSAVTMLSNLYSLPSYMQGPKIVLQTHFAQQTCTILCGQLENYLLHPNFYSAEWLTLFWAVRPGGWSHCKWWFDLVTKKLSLPGIPDKVVFEVLMHKSVVKVIEDRGFSLPPVDLASVAPTIAFNLNDLSGEEDLTSDPLLRSVSQEVHAWVLFNATMTALPDRCCRPF
jgi:hypothetical protein